MSYPSPIDAAHQQAEDRRRAVAGREKRLQDCLDSQARSLAEISDSFQRQLALLQKQVDAAQTQAESARQQAVLAKEKAKKADIKGIIAIILSIIALAVDIIVNRQEIVTFICELLGI